MYITFVGIKDEVNKYCESRFMGNILKGKKLCACTNPLRARGRKLVKRS